MELIAGLAEISKISFMDCDGGRRNNVGRFEDFQLLLVL